MIRYLNLQYLYNLLYRIYQWLISRRFGAPADWFTILWLGLALVAWVAIIVIALKIIKLRKAEADNLDLMLQSKSDIEVPKTDPRWERVLKAQESENPADWKLAIIEADNMLDEMVRVLRPAGENLGERLKSIEPSDFLTIQDAWEAHKVRNRIAHESDYMLTKRELARVINLFKNVFEEFEVI